MKIFIRSSELGGKKPEIVAYYDDATSIAPDAHGSSMTMLTVPSRAIIREIHEKDVLIPGPVRLIDNWRETVAPVVAGAEAEQRINSVFPLSQQIDALHETLDLLVKHGADVSKWPTDASARKAELHAMWNYVGQVNEQARAHKVLPVDPTSDKAWPTKIAKRK